MKLRRSKVQNYETVMVTKGRNYERTQGRMDEKKKGSKDQTTKEQTYQKTKGIKDQITK